jgi:hypothetical protein
MQQLMERVRNIEMSLQNENKTKNLQSPSGGKQTVLTRTVLEHNIRAILVDLLTNEAEIRAIQKEAAGDADSSHSEESSSRSNSTEARLTAQSQRVDRSTSPELLESQSAGVLKEICALYNTSRDNQRSRSEFRERYNPIAVSVVNAVDRRRNEKLPPIFETASDGNFVAVSDGSGSRYLVFPNLNLVLQELSFGPGAIGDVFECHGFEARCSYPNLRVEQPAIFESHQDGTWKLLKKGRLELGEGQEV